MKVLRITLSIAGGVALGLASGLLLRHLANHVAMAGPGSSSGGLNDSGKLEPGKNGNQGVGPEEDSPLTARLAQNISMSSGVTRWLYWWDAIEKAGPADFPRLARLAQGNRIATRLVAERWAEVAPKQFFDALRAAAKDGSKLSGDFADVLFSSWLKRDQPTVLAALSGAEDFPGRSEYRRQVATSIMESDPETALRVMSQWHIETYSPNMGAVKSWAAADPRHAAEFTLANPAGYVSREFMNIIGQAWAKVDPAQALGFASAQPGELASALAQTVLKNWAARDLSAAADWLSSADPATLNKFSPAFVEAWAKQDAAAALGWCESNLTGSTLVDAVKGVFNGAAQKDVAAAAALVAAMPAGPARSQAAAAVAEKWFPDGFANKAVPSETLDWLSSLDPDSIRKVVNNVSWRWVDNDPNGLATFLQAATNVDFPTYTYDNLAQSMARSDPAAALAWANRLPPGLALSAGSSAFGQWGRGQTDLAMQWLNQLPSDDPRRQPFFNNLLQQFAWDPEATDRFAQVAAGDPAAARSAIQGMALTPDRRAALLARLSPQAGQ